MSGFKFFLKEMLIVWLPFAFAIVTTVLIINSENSQDFKYCKPHTLTYIGQPIATGGIGSVLESEVKFSDGLRFMTFTSWLNGKNIGDQIYLREIKTSCSTSYKFCD